MELTVTTSIVLAAGACILVAIVSLIMAKFGAIASGLLVLALIGFAATYIWYSDDRDAPNVADDFAARDSQPAQLLAHAARDSADPEVGPEPVAEPVQDLQGEADSYPDQPEQKDSEDSVQRYVYAALPSAGNSRTMAKMVPLPRAELSKTLAPSAGIAAYRRATMQSSNRFDGINERSKDSAGGSDVSWKQKATTNYLCHNGDC
jgi:hypothetical protein